MICCAIVKVTYIKSCYHKLFFSKTRLKCILEIKFLLTYISRAINWLPVTATANNASRSFFTELKELPC